MRNQLKASGGTEKSTRIFHDTNFIYFGWGSIQEQWKREMERMTNGEIQVTNLSMSSVNPDSWNKMRVTHAKAVFSPSTLAEDMEHYSRMLKCEKDYADWNYL